MKKKILVVEDEIDIKNLIVYALENKGYDLTSTDDGEKAIKLVKENKPNIIILDWMLPSVSGLEVCRTIRRDETTQHIPIIMLTAKITENDKILGLDSGADDYITKPFSTNELFSRVKAILRKVNGTKNNKKLIIGTACGRSGLRWISEIHSSHKNCISLIEPFPNHESFFRYSTYNKLNIDHQAFYRVLKYQFIKYCYSQLNVSLKNSY